MLEGGTKERGGRGVRKEKIRGGNKRMRENKREGKRGKTKE